MKFQSILTVSLILFAFFCLSLASTEQKITSDTDWSLTADNNGGNLRVTSLKRFFNGLWYSSLEVNADKQNGQLNYIAGASAAPIIGSGLATYPAATLGYFGAQVSFEEPTQDDPFKLEVDIAAGFMATSFFQIQELDPSGSVIKTYRLNENNYKLSTVGSSGQLKWATYTAKIKKNILDLNPVGDIAITFLISDGNGKVNFDTLVSPTTLESVIQISGWKYDDSANNLVLSMGVASGSALWEGEVGAVVQQTTDNPVYFRLAGDAVYAAETKPVVISTFKEVDFEAAFGNNLGLKAKLVSKFKGNWETRKVDVAFAAGADLITYDPTLGARLEDDTSGSSHTIAFVAILLSLLVFALL